ncbi:hypothetical protein FKM82_013058 [Ascaphus truei]
MRLTGYSLSCTVCEYSAGTSCTGPSTPCPADHVCMSSYTVTTGGGKEKSKVFVRNCASQNVCVISGSVSVPDHKTRTGTSCCTTDNCTPPIPTLPAANDVMNGLMCPTCTSADTDECYTTDTMECSGDENMCLLQSTDTSGSISSTVAIRGCATESICNVGSQSLSNGDKNMEVKTNCIKGGIGLHPGFFFPAVIALMLI